ncbi:MAG: hypothetical protein ACLQPD_12450 [Desulfomonilaceae bacterium]
MSPSKRKRTTEEKQLHFMEPAKGSVNKPYEVTPMVQVVRRVLEA